MKRNSPTVAISSQCDTLGPAAGLDVVEKSLDVDESLKHPM